VHARTEDGEPQPPLARQRARLGQQRRERIRGPDGIAGDEQHATEHRIADQGLPAGGDQVLEVVAELEEAQRVVAVAADEIEHLRPHTALGHGPESSRPL
jgi:hypothetical protein